ncbi:hypothetical protein MNV49_003917 [Pseudohyphozyma bogoriensis]|nr:hypothetical protein MNV49_003917 [Pseudohyphozyma bogoriensis]
MIPTPITDHVVKDPAFRDAVYEPAEDTFILLDALEQDQHLLSRTTLALEIGSGSGCVSSFLATIVGPSSALFLCTDLSPPATLCALKTSKVNSTPLDPIVTNLTASLLPRLANQVDVLIFNPPYVETWDDELESAQESGVIERAWAGGIAGMRVTNKLLEQVETLLSPTGMFYLVAIPANKPDDIIKTWSSPTLIGEVFALDSLKDLKSLYLLTDVTFGRRTPFVVPSFSLTTFTFSDYEAYSHMATLIPALFESSKSTLKTLSWRSTIETETPKSSAIIDAVNASIHLIAPTLVHLKLGNPSHSLRPEAFRQFISLEKLEVNLSAGVDLHLENLPFPLNTLTVHQCPMIYNDVFDNLDRTGEDGAEVGIMLSRCLMCPAVKGLKTLHLPVDYPDGRLQEQLRNDPVAARTISVLEKRGTTIKYAEPWPYDLEDEEEDELENEEE